MMEEVMNEEASHAELRAAMRQAVKDLDDVLANYMFDGGGYSVTRHHLIQMRNGMTKALNKKQGKTKRAELK